MSNNWFDEAMTLEKSDNINNRKFKGKNYYENSLPSRRNIFKQRGRNIKELDNGYDEDDEDDDDADDFVGRGRVKIPRVQTSDGPEGCSCYPKRSDKNLPSMLYEGLQCKHTGLKGETHAGVAKFSGNWKEEYEEADPESTMPQKTSYILGYPKPINLDPGNSEGDENYANSYENQFEVDKGGFKHTSKRKPASQSSRKNVSRKSKKDHGKPDDVTQKTKEPKPFAGLLDDMEEDDEEPERPVAKPILEGITLPQIGFTPPSTPSRDKLRSHDRQSARSATRSLPPLPESPFLSNRDENSKTRRHSIIQEDDYSTDDDDIGGDGYRRKQKHSNIAEREFIGHYYDAANKRTRSYEIIPKFRKGLEEWNAYINDSNRQNQMISGLQGRRTTNGNFYTRGNSAVLEDDEYDADETDYEDDPKKTTKQPPIKGKWQKFKK